MTTPNYDLVGPFAGECAFCGGPDKRHRMYDAIVDMVRGGDDPERIADDYGMSVESVLEIARVGYE